MKPSEQTIEKDGVRTITRTSVEVTEVQEREYICRNCDQGFDEEEIVTVGIDVDEDGENEEERQFCLHCSDELFDYRPAESVTDYVNQRTRTWDAKDWAVSIASPVGSLTLAMATFFFGGTVLLRAAEGFSQALQESLTSISSTMTATTPAADILGLLPVLVTMVVLVALVQPVIGRF